MLASNADRPESTISKSCLADRYQEMLQFTDQGHHDHNKSSRRARAKRWNWKGMQLQRIIALYIIALNKANQPSQVDWKKSLERDVHDDVEFCGQPVISSFSSLGMCQFFFSSPGGIRGSVHGITLIEREWSLQKCGKRRGRVAGKKKWFVFRFPWADDRSPKKSPCGQFS